MAGVSYRAGLLAGVWTVAVLLVLVYIEFSDKFEGAVQVAGTVAVSAVEAPVRVNDRGRISVDAAIREPLDVEVTNSVDAYVYSVAEPVDVRIER